MAPPIPEMLMTVFRDDKAQALAEPRRHQPAVTPLNIGWRAFEAEEGWNPPIREDCELAQDCLGVEAFKLRLVEPAIFLF